MNVEAILSQPKLETLKVEGTTANVVLADQLAWSALREVLGPDPIEAWVLKGMQHVYDNGAVVFVAEFVRKPDEEL